ncbi:MAG: hypothetical protein A2046_05540 [Bacteroidetes bacterium GWA2_30_7]|nr:MAG: hypothetical protein A2046_05540 [Bacteroidetes bacterium GWA2_30_7]
MKKIIIFTLTLFTFFSCETIVSQENINLNDILSRKFQQMFISRGDNFPDFSLTEDKRNLFLVALHNDITVEDFQSKVNFNKEKIDSIINLLESKRWLHKIDEKYKPTVFIATKEDGDKLYEYAEPISKEIAEKIKEQLPKINEMFNETEISRKQTFDDWSFLVLSDVLLDSWQIFNVENQFLGKFARPARHGKNYYASIEEVTDDTEGFGIYGNQNGKISVYGNSRKKTDLSSTNHYISKRDNEILKSIAENFLPELIKILNENNEDIKQIYEKSGYSKEITFEEFFIWWYHFIYTQTTDYMAKMNLLKIPEGGNFVYEIEQ